MNRQAFTRLATALLGLALIVGALWLTFTLPSMHCGASGDIAFCQDWFARKVGIGTLGVVVGALALYAAAKMES